MAGRSSHPWFYAGKNTWYIWLADKKVSLGVRGEENKADAIKAWHKLMANGREAKPEPKADAVSVSEVLTAFLADAESRVQPITCNLGRTTRLDSHAAGR